VSSLTFRAITAGSGSMSSILYWSRNAARRDRQSRVHHATMPTISRTPMAVTADRRNNADTFRRCKLGLSAIIQTDPAAILPGMATKCPKCSVTVRMSPGRWSFSPPFACADLIGTQWGSVGDLTWCPTLARAMPPNVSWPGRSRRAYAEKMIALAKAKSEPLKRPRSL
jgi:hypothetical protein